LKNLAIITARGGSKRIPLKNIRLFFDRPIISYSIIAALESGLFDEVMVSTDNEKIAEIARQYGAKVPFYRSAKNSDDNASTTDALLEVLNEYKKSGQEFDNSCCIYPTAPFITNDLLTNSYNLLINNHLDSVFPIVPYGYPILRALQRDDKGMVSYMWPENATKRSQDLDQSYHDAGQFYWFNTSRFLNSGQLITKKSGAMEISELQMQDIDNEIDWKIAEIKYGLFQKK
jgi:N-acylneuraminate cytidylyltransferase